MSAILTVLGVTASGYKKAGTKNLLLLIANQLLVFTTYYCGTLVA